MKTIIKLSSILMITVTLNSQWVLIPHNNFTFYFAISFLNQNTGWVGGSDSGKASIYYTSNGGVNWIRQLNAAQSGRIECLFFLNNLTGWAGAYSGEIYRTTNGGSAWTSVIIAPNHRIRKIHFLNSSTGYIAGEAGCRKTTDGGLTWLITPLNYISSYGLYFFNVNTGLVANQQYIFKTTNAGQAFDAVLFILESIILYDFDFINSNTGYSAGTRKYTVKTTNQGNNWTNISSELNTEWINFYYDIDFVDENLGYAAGQYIWGHPGGGTDFMGIFYKTTNGGLNWNSIALGTSVMSYEAVQICESQIGYMAGYSGKIFKSTNAGYIPVVPISNEIPEKFSLSQNYPNPFNPVTKIRFSLPNPSEGGAQTVKLIIYDILGQVLETLVNDQLKPGTYEVEWDGSNFSSGVYYYSLVTQDFTQTRKMVLIK